MSGGAYEHPLLPPGSDRCVCLACAPGFGLSIGWARAAALRARAARAAEPRVLTWYEANKLFCDLVHRSGHRNGHKSENVSRKLAVGK